ncbi:teichoic acid D-Ala incorporation-associated protein DltX [Leuconostoc miyukkimchii]|nr:teichoic acid D-Ala incorporation-associated protein DltX [Leuconostoc miyukkimchii]
MFTRFFRRPTINFVIRTLFYFVVILALVYLYSYSGVGEGHFIYNEF